MDIEALVNTWDCTAAVAELTAALIRFPSVNPPAEIAPIADFIQDYLDRIGLETVRMATKPDLPCIIATMDCGPGPTLIFNGHMDVVPIGEREKWRWDPFGGEQREGYILGRGASDMKGGLAALMVALSKIAAWPHLTGKIVFMAVPDEETGGDFGTRYLLEQGLGGDACLVAEPSGQNPTIGQKGNLWLKAVTSGTPTHGSLSPVVGTNAIRRMTAVIESVYGVWETRRTLPEPARALIENSRALLRARGLNDPAEVLGRVSVNVGKIRGGRKVNMVPDRCEAEFDLRIPIGLTAQTVLEEVRQRLQEQFGSQVTLDPQSPPNDPNWTAPDNDFVQTVVGAIQTVTGQPSQPVLQWASSDARFFRHRRIPTIQYGPAEVAGIHGYNERIKVSALAEAARVYALLAHRYLGEA